MAKVGDAYIEIGAETDEAERDILRFLTKLRSAGFLAGQYYSSGWDRAMSRGLVRNTTHLFDQMGRTMLAPLFAGLGRLRMEMANATGPVSSLQKAMFFLRGAAVGTAISLGALSTIMAALSVQATNLTVITSAVGSLLVVATSAVGAVLSLGSGVATAFQSFLAAPGILMGVGAAAAVVIRAFSDMKDVLADLIPYYTWLGNEMSESFWDQAAQPIREMTHNLFPMLVDRMKAVGTAVGGVVGSMADFIGSMRGVALIDSILSNTAKGFTIMQQGFADLTEGLFTMGEAGARYLPRFGEWFNSISKSFNDWINAAVKSGDFFKWVDEGIVNLKALGSVIVDLMGIFGALGTAAANADGAATLPRLAQGLKDINAALRTDEWQEGLSSFFSVANAGTATVMNSFGQLFKQLGTMGSLFEQATRSVTNSFAAIVDGITTGLQNLTTQSNLSEFFTGLENAVTTLAGAIGPLMQILSAGLAAVGSLASAVAPVLVGVFTNLAGPIQSILPLVQNFINIFGNSLMAAMTALQPVISTLVTGILPTMLNIFGALLPIMGPLANLIASILVPAMEFFADKAGLAAGIISALVPHLSTWMNIIGKVANVILTALLPPITQLTEAVLPIFQDAINKIGPAFTTLLRAIRPVVELIANLLGPALEALVPIITFVVGMIVDNIVGAVEGIVKVITGVIDFVTAIFSGDWAAAWDALGQIVMGALQAAWNIVNLMLIGKVLGLIKSFIPMLLNLFRTGWQGLVNIVTSVWQTIQLRIMYALDGIRAVIGNVMGAIGTFFRTIWTSIVNFFISVWQTIQLRVMYGMDAVRAVITTVLNAIRSFFTMIWNSLISVVRTVWTTIRSVVSVYVNAVRSVVTTVLNAVRSFFVTIWNAILNVIRTVWTSISSFVRTSINAVRSVITSVMNAIRNTFTTVWNAIRNVVTTVINAVRSVITSVMNGIRSTITSIMNAVRSTFTSVWNAIRSVVTSVINAVRSVITSGMNTARSIVTSVLSTIRNGFNTAMNAVKTAVSDGIGKVLGFFREAPGKIKGALGNAKNILTGAGKAIIDGFLGGLKATWGKVTDFVGGIASWIRDNKGPVSYDRTILVPAGRAFMEGLVSGLDDGMRPLKSELSKITDEIVGGVDRATRESSRAMNGFTASTMAPIDRMMNDLLQTARPEILTKMSMRGIDRTSLAPLGATAAARIAAMEAARRAEAAGGASGDTYVFEEGALQIRLEDLEDLRTLEEFLEMVRVKIRKRGG